MDITWYSATSELNNKWLKSVCINDHSYLLEVLWMNKIYYIVHVVQHTTQDNRVLHCWNVLADNQSPFPPPPSPYDKDILKAVMTRRSSSPEKTCLDSQCPSLPWVQNGQLSSLLLRGFSKGSWPLHTWIPIIEQYQTNDTLK